MNALIHLATHTRSLGHDSLIIDDGNESLVLLPPQRNDPNYWVIGDAWELPFANFTSACDFICGARIIGDPSWN